MSDSSFQHPAFTSLNGFASLLSPLRVPHLLLSLLTHQSSPHLVPALSRQVQLNALPPTRSRTPPPRSLRRMRAPSTPRRSPSTTSTTTTTRRTRRCSRRHNVCISRFLLNYRSFHSTLDVPCIILAFLPNIYPSPTLISLSHDQTTSPQRSTIHQIQDPIPQVPEKDAVPTHPTADPIHQHHHLPHSS